MITFTVPPDYPEQKVRYFLASQGRVSSTLWKKIKWHGQLFINGQYINNAAKAIVRGNDIISYELAADSKLIPCNKPLNIIYEDDWLLIINKPAAQIIHPTNKACCDTTVNIIAGYYIKTAQKTGCHPVYRLDRNTTGLIIVAKQPQIQYYLTKSHDKICRFYKAFVSGHMHPKEAMFCEPIARKNTSIIEQMVSQTGKPALTRYNVLSEKDNYSLLNIRLYSGRTHQIRVHLSHAHHPLLGDDLYGGDCTLIKRQALHAYRIIFIHPITKKKFDISIPLPEDMLQLL
ncbi:RluA family pseudouridine synthase [Pectinatus sottacetonis]|uniref:RluA family pseudouridine synthase n=1 Tax=Pectinatus sottacetonis TaxID=1002795 RepID=UPI0018C726A6|nr:RluA family pseudouridine synthase [Pectinatus sottacetonis]